MCRVQVIAGSDKYELVKTTPGRLMLFDIVPKGIKFDRINIKMGMREVSLLIETIYSECGHGDTVTFSDKLMSLGFKYATLSGVSFGKNDMVIPQTKGIHVESATHEVQKYEKQYQQGLITKNEKYNKVVDAWQKCTDAVASDMMHAVSLYTEISNINSIYMMADSGARGSQAQMRQLAGMRGLMAKPSGEIIPTPIISNLREGQSVTEYFISTHGARKGLADTALKTANSGYLTRRLVDVAHDTLIVENDCGTGDGLVLRAIMEGGIVVVKLPSIVFGRVSAVDIFHPTTNELILGAGELIDNIVAEVLEEIGLTSIKVRSVLSCKSKEGVCAKCYGADLSTGKLVSLGEAVGIIAAQSVGEPGTQLTMRTFHVGGAAVRRVEVSSMSAFCAGTVKFMNKHMVKDKNGQSVVLSRAFEVIITDSMGNDHVHGRIPCGGFLHVEEGDYIAIGGKISDWDPYTVPIITERGGVVSFVDIINNVSVVEQVDESSGVGRVAVVDWRQGDKVFSLRPRIEILDDNGKCVLLPSGSEAVYMIPVGAVLNVRNGDNVTAGTIVAKISKEYVTTRDITGGLPRVIELFEARKSKDNATMSEVDGYVTFGRDYYRARRRVIISDINTGEALAEYLVPKGRHITVSEGDFVKKGDLLMNGDPDLHEILRILGLESLAEYVINEIQRVYRLQGVRIDNKHFEVILRKMLQKVEIIKAGDTTFIVGEQVDGDIIDNVNFKMRAIGAQEACVKRILLGITRASLQTKSFISAASFQETTRVLAESAVAGKVDNLKGLKENVIVGRLLPVGSGFMTNRIKKVKSAEAVAVTCEV